MAGGGLVTVEQCKRIIAGYMGHSGRGGFLTGVVKSVQPLIITVDSRFDIGEGCLYVTDNGIGLIIHLKHQGQLRDDVELRRPLQPGEGVLLLCRPDGLDQTKYILLDRIQPYVIKREVDTQ